MTQEHIRPIGALIILLILFLPIAILLTKSRLSDVYGLLDKTDQSALTIASVVFLFSIILIVYLLTSATWTAELLKVLAGILVGVTASRITSARSVEQKIEQGNNNIQAMGDVIEKMEGDIQKIEEALISHTNSENTIDKLVVANDTKHLKLETDDQAIIYKLESLSRDEPKMFSDDYSRDKASNWCFRYIDTCLQIPEFREKIRFAYKELVDDGWDIKDIRFDNRPKGIDVGFSVEKRISLDNLDRMYRSDTNL